MTRIVKTFPVKLADNKSLIILETRAAIADVLRRRTARKISDGRNAGVDLFTISQRYNLQISEALGGSRLLRSVARSLVGWAVNVEFAAAQNNVPCDAPPMSIGGSKEALTVLDNYTCVISLSGVTAVGQADHLPDMPIAEVRLSVTQSPEGDDLVMAQIVYETDSNNGGASATQPQPVVDVDA